MTDVFISYSRGDKEKIRILAQELERRGLRVWWDSHLTTGHAYRAEISEKLDEARLVIVVWSRLSVGSRFVCDEADEGAQRGTLFPALLELVDIPLGFRQIQTADLTHWRGGKRDAALDSFVDTIVEAAKDLSGGTARPSASPQAQTAPPPRPQAQRQEMQRTTSPRGAAKPVRKKKARHTVTGSAIRAKLLFNSFILATLIAAAFGALAYTSDFVFPSFRPVLVAAIFVLTFLARLTSFWADKAMGSASMRLMSGSFVTLFGLAALSIAPLITEGRLYAGALQDVRMDGIEGADINGVAYDGAGGRLVTVSDDGQARLWDARTGVGLGTFDDHENWVWAADFSPTGDQVVTASRDLTARIWDTSSREQRLVLEGHTASVYDAKFSPDGGTVATGSGDHIVRLFNAETGDLIRNLQRHQDDVRSVAFSPDGQWLASASADGTVVLWNRSRGAFQRTIGRGNAAWNDVVFSSDGRLIGAVNDDGDVRIWTVSGNSVMRASVPGRAYGLAFADDRIAVGSSDGLVRLFDISSGALLVETQGHGDAVRDVDADPSGGYFVSASRDNTARIWSAVTGEEVQIVGHIESAIDLPFALDVPPVAVASRAPQPIDFRGDPQRTALLLGKGLAIGFVLLVMGLLVKLVVSMTPLKEQGRLVTPLLFVGAVGYWALLMLSSLPLQATLLWATLAFLPATVLGLIRWLGASMLIRQR